MDIENMIELKDVNIRDFVKEVYILSSPSGLGFLHSKEGGLTDEEVDKILHGGDTSRIVANMDYVNGRSCKMGIFRDVESGKIYIRDSWYDHSREELEKLLEKFGIELP